MKTKTMTAGKTADEGIVATEMQVKTFEVFGYKISSNSCSALEYSLYVKKFGEWVKHTGATHGFTLTMNHIEIWELLNEAIGIKVSGEADTDIKWLVIETKDFIVSFKIPQEAN